MSEILSGFSSLPSDAADGHLPSPAPALAGSARSRPRRRRKHRCSLLGALLLAITSTAAQDDGPAIETAAAEADVNPDTIGALLNEADLSEREQQHREYKFKYESGEYQEALEPATNVVNLIERESGPHSPLLVEPLMDLAELQTATDQPVEAVANYQRSIELVEENYSDIDPQLVRPLTALGEIYNAVGRYEDAIPYLERAQHITRRHDGLYNLGQVQQLEQMAISYHGLEDIRMSVTKQASAYQIYQRKYGARSPEIW